MMMSRWKLNKSKEGYIWQLISVKGEILAESNCYKNRENAIRNFKNIIKKRRYD